MSQELKEIYNKCYEEGQEQFHTHLPLDLIYSNVYKYIKNHLNDKKVLDLGCGDGSFLRKYVTLQEPQEIIGYDFSEVGIEKAKNDPITAERKIQFRCKTFEDLKFEIDEKLSIDIDYFDVITSIGVIEHLEKPDDIFYIATKCLKPKGLFVLEYPNFLNIRGIIWKTLELFVNAEMSKTDKHMIMPDKIFEWMNYYDFECEKILTFDHNRGMYGEMINDFSKRLKLAMRNKVENLDEKIQEFFKYLNFVINKKVFNPSSANGAEVIWVMRKKE